MSRPAINGWRCEGVYVRATVDAAASPGQEALESRRHQPRMTTKPGGAGGSINHTITEYQHGWAYGLGSSRRRSALQRQYPQQRQYPVGTFRITETLPVSTTFVAAWLYGNVPFVPVMTGADYVVWEYPGLDNGYRLDFEIVLKALPNAAPGTVLVNTVEITRLRRGRLERQPGQLDGNALRPRPQPAGAQRRAMGQLGREHPPRVVLAQRRKCGQETVKQVTLTDTYPAGMRMDGGLGGGFWRWWDWRDYGDHFTMTLELLEPGWSAGFNFGLITDTNPLPFGLVFTNTAEVALVANDTNPSDNVDTAVLTTGPDLWVKKDLVAGSCAHGELVTFSLAFGNDVEGWQWWWGMQGNAILTDMPFMGFEYISALQHWCGNGVEWCDHAPGDAAGSTNVWLLWPLNAGEWNEIYLTGPHHRRRHRPGHLRQHSDYRQQPADGRQRSGLHQQQQ